MPVKAQMHTISEHLTHIQNFSKQTNIRPKQMSRSVKSKIGQFSKAAEGSTIDEISSEMEVSVCQKAAKFVECKSPGKRAMFSSCFETFDSPSKSISYLQQRHQSLNKLKRAYDSFSNLPHL